MGHEVTSIVAVVNDSLQVISSSNRDHPEYEVMHVGGVDVSNFLKPEMENEGLLDSIDFNSPQGQKEVDKYKAQYCYFVEDYSQEKEKLNNPTRSQKPPKRTSNVDEESLQKPIKLEFVKDSPISRRYSAITREEHSTLTLDTPNTAATPSLEPKKQCFFEGSEVFFQPTAFGANGFGLDRRIYNAIVKVPDIEFHGILYQNIVISGGSAKIGGIKERLRSEIICAVPRGVQLNISFPYEMDVLESNGGCNSEEFENKANSHGLQSLELAAFRGACRLTQMPHYISLLIEKKEFEDTTVLMRNPIRRSMRVSRPPSMIRILAE